MSSPIAFVRKLPHGTAVGIAIPPDVGEADLAELHPAERAHATGLPPARRPPFVAGRRALRIAIEACAAGASRNFALLPAASGAPLIPSGVFASLSHKRALAVALACADDDDGLIGLGVDLEELRPLRGNIARRVLTESERAVHDALPPASRDPFTLFRFSLKEAFYKAASAHVQRRLGFHDLEVGDVAPEGAATLRADWLSPLGLTCEGWAAVLPVDFVTSTVRLYRLAAAVPTAR